MFYGGFNRAIPRPQVWLAGLLLLLISVQAAAAVRLTQMRVDSRDNDVVEVHLLLQGKVATPRHFAIQQPPRIVVDIPGADIDLPENHQSVGEGALKSLQAVTAGGRTRVVLNLTEMVHYDFTRQGQELVVRLGSPQALRALESPQRKAKPELNEVKKVDFRRGSKGEGRVIITMSEDNIPTDIHEEGGQLVLELLNARLPKSLERRLDVTDFATPVRTIDSYTRDGVVRVVVSSAGDVEHLAFQTDNRFYIDVSKPLPKTATSELDKGKYKGKKLTLDFQNIEVRAVLQIIADFTGINIVASDSVTGSVTLHLKEVPWDEALDIILKTKGLDMRKSGNIIMVAPLEEIAERDKRDLEAQKQLEQLSPLENESIQINYAKASDIANLLKSDKTSMMSPRGSVTIDERTNKLLVKDTPINLREIHRLIKDLDVPVRQVLIESRIVIANDDFSREIGARFGVSAGNTSGGDTGAASGSLGGTDTVIGNGGNITSGTLPDLGDRLNVNLPVQNPAGALAISVLHGNTLLDMELTALQTEGRGEVISNPRVITSNQKEAQIEQGVEIPYLQATSSGATSVAFKKAVLSLKVTPQITPDNRVIMDLRVSKDSVGEVFNGVPSVNTREVTTQVLVNDGDTVVLGGIYEQTYSEEEDKVPFFGDIPILGALFRQKRKVDDKAELLIFVTPKVIHEQPRSP